MINRIRDALVALLSDRDRRDEFCCQWGLMALAFWFTYATLFLAHGGDRLFPAAATIASVIGSLWVRAASRWRREAMGWQGIAATRGVERDTYQVLYRQERRQNEALDTQYSSLLCKAGKSHFGS